MLRLIQGGDILKLIEEDYLRADDRVSIKFYRDGKMSTTKLRLTRVDEPGKMKC